MFRPFVPANVKIHNFEYHKLEEIPEEIFDRIRAGFEARHADKPLISVNIIAWNEESNILRNLSSLSAMKSTYPVEFIYVDNNSTDKTSAIIRKCGITPVFESQQGYGFARQAALENSHGKYIITGDADTIYPPDYITRADALIGDDPAVVGAQAIDIYGPATSLAARWQRWRLAVTSRILWDQGHTGTYGQAFRMDVLAAAGGPKNDAWPFVLYDHELIHRVVKLGRLRMAADHVCWPSSRRVANSHVRWNLLERLLYAFTPFAAKDWFFYRFLSPRLRARNMWEAGLRVRDWEQ